MQLMIIFIMIIRLSVKWQKIEKNACYDSPQLMVESSDVLSFLSNSPKSKDINLTIMYVKEKHENLTSERLEPAYVWHSSIENN